MITVNVFEERYTVRCYEKDMVLDQQLCATQQDGM